MSKNNNPNYKENLKPFKPGECGNPNGRPKGSISIVRMIEKALNREATFTDPITKEKTTKELQEWVATALLAKAMKGDVSAIKEVLERTDGKVVQKTDMRLTTHEDALKELE